MHFRIPPGTSAELTDLLMGLLKRDARERIDFETFFNHAFIAVTSPPPPPPPPPPPAPTSQPITVPSTTSVGQDCSKAGSSLPETGMKLLAPKNSAPNLVALGRQTKPVAMVSRTPPIPGILPPSPVTMSKQFFQLQIALRSHCILLY